MQTPQKVLTRTSWESNHCLKKQAVKLHQKTEGGEWLERANLPPCTPLCEIFTNFVLYLLFAKVWGWGGLESCKSVVQGQWSLKFHWAKQCPTATCPWALVKTEVMANPNSVWQPFPASDLSKASILEGFLLVFNRALPLWLWKGLPGCSSW